MFTEEQLVSFGNYLFRRYDVQEYSTDGKNTPLFQRQVHDADLANWRHEAQPNQLLLPSQHQIEDRVNVEMVVAEKPVIIPATVVNVHFYPGKVKYDLEIELKEGATRIYNVDSCFVMPIE